MLLLLFCLLLAAAFALAAAVSRLTQSLDAAEEETRQMQQERERVVDFMHHMVEALGEGLSRQNLLQRIVHASILCSGALSACIFEKTGRGTMRGVAVEGLFPPHRPLEASALGALGTRAKFIAQLLKSEEFPLGEGLAGRVALTGIGELVTDPAADPRIVQHEDPALAVRSLIAVPLAFRERFFGVLVVANPGNDQPFTASNFTLLQSLAEQAALALHNAEFLNLQLEKKQLDLDLSVASGIQQMLLPRSAPEVHGLDVDARYTPAQQVGGDLYDLIPLSDTRLAVVVADVAGKGIPASLLMAICRTNLRQIAPRYASPARVLVELNRVLATEIHAGLYITMLYAVIDTAAETVTFARAGHELPLLVHRNRAEGGRRAEFIGAEGMALGMVPDEIFSAVIAECTQAFVPGDLCVLYTDGLTEAPNDEGEEFSGPRLAAAVQAVQDAPAQSVNDGILAAVQRFAGETAQRDDFTLVTVRRV